MAKELQDLEFTVGEGPGIDAFTSSLPVLVEDLTAAHPRWPLFTGAALSIGLRSIYSYPLQFGAITLGVLTLSSVRAGALTRTGLDQAPRVTEAVTSLILHMQAEDRSESLAWSLDAGDHRAVVHQATGMVAAQLGCGLDEALLRLRGRAFADEVPIDDVAEAVVECEFASNPRSQRLRRCDRQGMWDSGGIGHWKSRPDAGGGPMSDTAKRGWRVPLSIWRTPWLPILT